MSTKLIPLVIALALSTPAIFAATPAATDAQSEYDKAVKSYVDAAAEQLNAIRVSVDQQLTGAPKDAKARFQKVYAGLAACDELLAKLKQSGPADFDQVKSNLEGARGKMLKDLDAARKT